MCNKPTHTFCKCHENNYDIILADPSWNFKTWSAKGEGRSPKYKRMSLDDIKNLPVSNIAAKDSVLFLWATYPMLPHAIETMESWGFTFKTVAFTWVKLLKHWKGRDFNNVWHMGNGYYTRANPEIVLLGTKGKPLKRISKSVRNLVVSPISKHSAKPEEVQDRIEQLFGKNHNMLELFARRDRRNWTCIGLELNMTIEDFLQEGIKIE